VIETSAMNPSTGTAMFAPDPRRSRGHRGDAARNPADARREAWRARIESWLRRGRRERAAD